MKQIEETGVENMRELSRLAEIGKLSGGFIHDLANHVSVMSLSMGYFEERLKQESERIRKHTLESARARRNMREFVESMRRHIRGRDIACYFSPKKKLSELVSLFGFRAQKEGVVMSLSSTKKVGSVRLYGSRLRFSQLFSNILSNAIEALEKGGAVTERVVVVAITVRNGVLHASIRDNGRGMSKEVKKRIFEPYFSTRHGGVGLGLTTVKDITEKDFGGSISVHSSLGMGTTFSVRLPIASRRR
jgi:signal transduction histidine kinase